MRLVSPGGPDEPVQPGLGITRAEWHALLDGLLELERRGALPGIRAVIGHRLDMARADVSFSPDEAVRAAEIAVGTRTRAMAAAMLAALIDREDAP